MSKNDVKFFDVENKKFDIKKDLDFFVKYERFFRNVHFSIFILILHIFTNNFRNFSTFYTSCREN